MRWCEDPLVGVLRDHGYQLVRYPQAGLQPTQLSILEGKRLAPLGRLESVFRGREGAVAPTVRTTAGPDLSGEVRHSNFLSLGLGLGLLSRLIEAIGGDSASLVSSYARARSLRFSFSNVKRRGIDIVELDKYLSRAEVEPDLRYVGQLLDADEVYVVVSCLRSQSFTVEALGQDSQKLGLDCDSLQGLVGGEIQVSSASAENTAITYAGKSYLTFAVRAVQLFYDQHQYSTMKLAQARQAGLLPKDLENARLLRAGLFLDAGR